MGALLLRKYAVYNILVTFLVTSLFSFTPLTIQAAPTDGPNEAYFKEHKYTTPLDGSDIPNIDPSYGNGQFAAGAYGGFDVADAFKKVRANKDAIVMSYPDEKDVDNPVYLQLKDEQRNVNQYYLKLITDYENYNALLASHKKNPQDTDAFEEKPSGTKTGNATVLKFEIAPSFIQSLKSTYETPDGSFAWLNATIPYVIGGPLALIGPAFYKSEIQPQIDNNTSPATYWNKIQDERKQVDTALAHIYVLTTVLHSLKPGGKSGYYRNGVDDLSSVDTLGVGKATTDGHVATIYSKKSSKDSPVKLLTLRDLLSEYGPYDQGGAKAAPIDVIGALSSEAQQSNGESLKGYGRCGTSSGGLFNLPSLNYDFCVLVDAFSNLNNTLLYAGGYLLQVTSGIPSSSSDRAVHINPEDSGQASVQNFWDGLLPSAVTTPFQNIMIDTNSSIGKTVASSSRIISTLINVLMVLLFVISAIASILQIQVNTFGFRKLIPSLVVYFIIAQFSFIFIRSALEVVGQVSNGIIGFADTDPNTDKGGVFQNYVNTIAHVRGENGGKCFTTAAAGAPASPVASSCTGEINNAIVTQQFILNIFMLVGAGLLIFLGGMFIFRVIIFTIAIPLAPLAIICRAVPPLGFIWSRWWKMVSNWIIMPIPVVATLLLASVYFKAANVTPGGSGLLASLFNYCVGIAFLIAATKLPGTFAGEAKAFLDRYNALGKSAYNKSITATKKAAGDQIQAKIGTSKIGDAMRWNQNRLAVKKEELDLNKKGEKTDIQGIKNDKRRESINSKLALATQESQDRRTAKKNTLMGTKDSLIREQNDLFARLADPTLSDDEARAAQVRMSAISEEINGDKGLDSQIRKVESDEAEVTKILRDKGSLESEVERLKEPTRAGRRNLRTYSDNLTRQKQSEVRKSSLDQDKGEAERILASGSANNSYNQADELLRLSQARTAEAKEEARESSRNNFLQAKSAPEGLEREALKSRRVLTGYQSKIRGKRNDTAESDAERDARHEIIFSGKFDDLKGLNGDNATDSEKNALASVRTAQKDFAMEFSKSVSDNSSSQYPGVDEEMKAVLDPVANPPSGDPTGLEKRRKAAINVAVLHKKLNTENNTDLETVKASARKLLALVDPTSASGLTLAKFESLTPANDTERKNIVSEYKRSSFVTVQIANLLDSPYIVIAGNGIGV